MKMVKKYSLKYILRKNELMRLLLLLSILFLSSCNILERIQNTRTIIRIDDEDIEDGSSSSGVIFTEELRRVLVDTVASIPEVISPRVSEIEDRNVSPILVVQQNTISKQNNTTSTTSGGQILYSVPDTMQVAKNYRVVVRISSCQKNVEIEENISGRVVKKSIKTSARMEVELVDPDGDAFLIKPITKQKQIVDSSYTEWIWNVSPKKPGDNKLDLVVSIIIDDDVKQTVLSDRIWVRSNTSAVVKKFWYDNWRWSFEKILIPIVAWLGGILIGSKLKDRK